MSTTSRRLKNPLVPARTPLEASIVSVFKDTFELEEVGAEDDFFELNGDSLTAKILALNILDRTGRNFKMHWLLYASTPRSIAALLEEGAPKATAFNRPPLFMVHGRDGIMLPSKEFFSGLAPDQQLEIFELPDVHDRDEVLTSITQIAGLYLAQLKATYPEGPVLLGGNCSGCLIAIEMAAQLSDEGRPVHQLLMIDPIIPLNVQRYVERSIGIELPWRKAVKRWPRRLFSLLYLGRASDGTEEADFDDNRLRRLRVFINRWQIAQESRKYGKTGGGYHGIIASVQAKATLRAAYSHYRPRPYYGNVDIISSGKQRSGYEPDKGLWGVLLPRRRIHTVTKRHSELFTTQAGKTAATLQLCIDRAIEKLPTAPLEQV